MDQLAADQQEQLKKCSTDRLRLKFVQSGGSEEAASLMDRSQLLDALTRVMLKQNIVMKKYRIKQSNQQLLALEDQRMKIKADTRKAEMELRKTELELELKMKLEL